MVDFCHNYREEIMMRHLRKVILALMLAIVIIFTVITPASAQVTTDTAYQTATQYMLKMVPNPTLGDEWVIIALARGEAKVPANYYEKYYQNLQQQVKALKGELHKYKFTEYSRIILALSAIGKNATNVGGYNLVEKLADFNSVVWQGVNGPIFALIALDTWQYEATVREKLLQEILNKQLANGGFSLDGKTADTDVTAMAIQALAPYQTRPTVAAAVERAVALLQASQYVNGKYSDLNNAESAAQIVTALSALGVAQQNAQLQATYENMMSFYYAADGGFKHVLTETVSNGMATEQASYALAAYQRLIQGKTTLYNMLDTRGSFIDTNNSWAKEYIEQAVDLGLLNGYSDGTFRPINNLTRAQAVSILVRALKLTNTSNAPYTDLGNMATATKNEIAAAYEAGIIKYNDGKFNPKQNITRVQLGLMLMRTHNLQNESYNATDLVTYKDSAKLDAEQKLALTFLAQYGIATGSNGQFNPYNPTTRAQATKMFVQFVKAME